MLNISYIIPDLKNIVGNKNVLTEKEELLTYESDGLVIERADPWAVVLPSDANQISSIVKLLSSKNIPFVPRGAGTGLSGGCLPVQGGVVIALTKMNNILEVDYENRLAVLEPGVVNQWVTDKVSEKNFFFAPDPSSGQACTVGGNVSENAGGPHTMKYGVTVNHILGLEIVLPDGKIVQLGGRTRDVNGLDLVSIFTGSEGTFGIVTKIIVNFIPQPQKYLTFYAVFDTIDDATRSISGFLEAGISPAALEMVDNIFIGALNTAFGTEFPEDAGAILIIELDGPAAGMDILNERVVEITKKFNVREIKAAKNEEERAKLWKARKLAFGAVGRISPNYYTQDSVVPRTKLPDILRIINEVSKKYDIVIANAFHAGDGNLHPCLLYDEREEGQVERVLQASTEILKACIALGGTISGEHGIGSEKNDYMGLIFSKDDLECMQDLKNSFNPTGLLNPGKIFPTSKSCGETRIKQKKE